MMNDEISSESAELNSDHGDKNPSHGAGLGGFVNTDESPVVHQPAEGALHDLAPGQDFEPKSETDPLPHCDRFLSRSSGLMVPIKNS